MQALLPLLLLIPLWFLLVRPQQRRIRAQQAMVGALQVGDEVIMSAGIYGSIVALEGDVVTLEVADDIQLRVARMAIARRLEARTTETQGTVAAEELDMPGEVDTAGEPGQP